MSTFTPMVSVSYPGVAEEAGSAEPLPIAETAASEADGTTMPSVVVGPQATAHTANSVLASSSVSELRFLRVDENEEVIHLSGRVRSFYHKQLAQEAIRPVAAGRQVINRVDVSNY